MRPPTYSIPIGITVIALAGLVATGCSGSGLRSGRDGGEADAVASLGGQAGSIASAGGAGGATWTTDTAGSAGSAGTAGSADAGGAVGSGGATGLGGTKGCCSVGVDAAGDVSKPDGGGTDGKVVCGPVCLIYCAYGNVVDENGCETCGCKPPPTVNPTCPCASGTAQTVYGCLTCGYCANGYTLDANGCPTCACNPPPCSATRCASCLSGYVKDASGCQTCTCLPDPSLPCKQLDASQCGTSTHCRWLMPSCGLFGTNLTNSESGCYDQVDCTTTSDCSETGSACVDRMVAPPGGPGGDWCGVAVRVCL